MNADFAANGGYIQFNEESGLTLYEKDDNWLMQELYKGSTEKIKNYRAVVYSKQGLSKATLEAEFAKIKNLSVKQNTPIRVMHRRPLMVRDKEIFAIELTNFMNEHYFVVDIKASAGCYIKEFVHGDFNRTKPNLSGIFGQEL